MTSRTKRMARRTMRPAWRLSTAPKIKPLDPDKPLAPYRVPALKTFDSHMPGQLALGADQTSAAEVAAAAPPTEETPP